jgi:hypothetical protein
MLSVILLLVVVLPPLSTARACEESAVLRVAPERVVLEKNQTRTIAIRVEDVSDLYGADIIVTFDPRVVRVIDADPAKAGVQVQQGPFLDPGFTVYNFADNEAGMVRFTMTQLNPSPAKSGNGVLFYIKLRAINPGRSAIKITKDDMATRDGVMIETSTVPGRVVVKR